MPQAFNPLTPPNMSGATTISDTGHTTVAWPASIVNLSDTTDYILDCPTKRTGIIKIDGGRNIFIPRLWIELQAGTSATEMVYVANGPANRIIHIEHCLLDPKGQQADAFKTHGTSDNLILQLKNTLVRTLVGTTNTGGIHADVLQTSAGLKELWAEDLTGYTTFDGFMMQQEASLVASYTPINVTSVSVTAGVMTVNTASAHNLNTTTHKFFQLNDSTGKAAFSGGFMVQTTPLTTRITANFGDGSPASAGSGIYTLQEMNFPYKVGNTNLNRVNIVGLTNPLGSPSSANQAIRFGARTAQNSGFNTGHPNDDGTPVDLEGWAGTFDATNFYGTPPPGKNAGQFVQPDSGSSTWSTIRPSYHSSATPPYVDWPTHPQVTSTTKMISGSPPGGDYCTTATAFDGFGAAVRTFEFEDGFETGVFDPVWTATGTPTITNDSALHGANGMKVTGAGQQFIARTPNPTVPTILVDRFYFRVPTGGFPVTGNSILWSATTGAATVFRVRVAPTTNHLEAQVGAGTTQTFGTVTADQIYCVDLRVNSTAGTMDWQIDTVAQTQATGATGSTFASVHFGNDGASVTAQTIHLDDLAQSQNTADYPLGPIAPPDSYQQRLFQKFASAGTGAVTSVAQISLPTETYTPANNGIFHATMDALNLSEFNGTNFLGTAGTAISASASRPFAGAGSLRMSKDLAGTSVSELVYAETILTSPTNELYGRFYFNISNAPNGTAIIHSLYPGSTGTQMQFRLAQNSPGPFVILQMWLPGTTNSTQKLITFAVDTWYRVEYHVNMTSTTTGQMTANIYNGSSTTPLVMDQVVGAPTTFTGSITSANGYVQANVQKPRWGCSNATPTTGTWYFDNLQLNAAANGYPGP